LRDKLEVVAQQFQKQLADTAKALDEARRGEKRATVEATSAKDEIERLKAELSLCKKEAERLRQLLDKKKKEPGARRQSHRHVTRSSRPWATMLCDKSRQIPGL